tara:strand:+ start:426 stop:1745 length:1320 start_codon:yes stop_codon:yes gene_type:complete
MAQDYSGLLTGLDTRPINPMQGMDREGRMAQRAQGFANRMTGGLLQAAGQDPRTPQQKSNAALSSLNLDTNDVVEQEKNIKTVQAVDPMKAQQLAQMYKQKNAKLAQTQGLIDTANELGLENTVQLLQSGGSTEDAAKSIYEEQERRTVNEGGRQGKLAIAKNKNVSPKVLAQIKNGQFDEMSDELFLAQIQGKKATIKAFTNAQGEVQSRRVDGSANVWNPETSKWESPMDLGLKPAPVVTKQISAADGITSKLTGKMLDNFLELNDEARNSLKILGTNEESITALNSAIEPGFTGDLKLELMRIGKAAGIVPEDMMDKVAATELFLKQRNSQVLPLIKNLGTGTAVSDNDVKFIKDIVGASVTLDDATIRSIIAIQNQGALDAIRLNNEALERLNTVEGTQLDQSVYQSLYIQAPETQNPMQSVLSTRARDYLNRIK